VSVRDRRAQALAAQRPAMGPGHFRRGPGFINEHQPVGVEIGLLLEPDPVPLQDVGAILLGRVAGLFCA
jgi:hypothetical protein